MLNRNFSYTPTLRLSIWILSFLIGFFLILSLLIFSPSSSNINAEQKSWLNDNEDEVYYHHQHDLYQPEVCLHEKISSKKPIMIMNQLIAPIKDALLRKNPVNEKGFKNSWDIKANDNVNSTNTDLKFNPVINNSEANNTSSANTTNTTKNSSSYHHLDFKPIRIHADFSNIEQIWNTTFPKKVKFIKEHLIPTAFSFFKMALQVYPTPGPIIPLPDICYNTEIPIDHLLYGINQTDLIIYVTGTYEPNESYGAYAIACAQDSKLYGRPVIGQINYNLAYFTVDNKTKWDRLGTTLHEITHVLGFSRYLFEYFVDDKGERIGFENIVQNIQKRGLNDTLLLSLPSVIKVAQEHYNCSSIIGQELENRGDLGSRGSHWEQIVLKNEIMTGISTADRVYSKFTLAVLESSGWYKVNYSVAQPLYWGKNKGCDFVDHGCAAPSSASSSSSSPASSLSYAKFPIATNYEEFCQDKSTLGCTYDTIGLAECGYGGLFFDKCMSYNKYSNGDCRLSINHHDRYLGEIYSTNSRCVKSNIILKGQKSKYDVRCYEAWCSRKNSNAPFELNFRLSDGSTLVCKHSNDLIKAPRGWEGTLKCPNIENYCGFTPPSECPFGCWNNGKCIDGTCYCYEGWSGDSCSQTTIVITSQLGQEAIQRLASFVFGNRRNNTQNLFLICFVLGIWTQEIIIYCNRMIICSVLDISWAFLG